MRYSHLLNSDLQIESFRELENEEGEALTHNFRPVQPVGDRTILLNVNKAELPPDTDVVMKIGNKNEDGPSYAKPTTVVPQTEKPLPTKRSKKSGAPRFAVSSTCLSILLLLTTSKLFNIN